MIANSNLFAVATIVIVTALLLPAVPIPSASLQPGDGLYAIAPSSVPATLSAGAPVGVH